MAQAQAIHEVIACEIDDLENLLKVVQTKGVRTHLEHLLADRKHRQREIWVASNPTQPSTTHQANEQHQTQTQTQTQTQNSKQQPQQDQQSDSTREPIQTAAVQAWESHQLHPVENYVSLDTFGWDDARGKEKVSVYVLSGIDGVGDLPAENITCSFGKQSFDLKIHGLNGRNFRLFRDNLEREIVPEKSFVRVKKNRVVLALWKTDKFGRWNDLTAKDSAVKSTKDEDEDEDEDEDKDKDKDPTVNLSNAGSARVIDLMRKAYEASDDVTRRSIAKTWQERQVQQHQKAQAA